MKGIVGTALPAPRVEEAIYQSCITTLEVRRPAQVGSRGFASAEWPRSKAAEPQAVVQVREGDADNFPREQSAYLRVLAGQVEVPPIK